jgi:hypothetical protein
MAASDPAEVAGLIVMRVWVEPGATGNAGDALRARIITARHAGPQDEAVTLTRAGVDDALVAVRAFLVELTGG